MAALAIGNEGGMEIVTLGPDAVAEIVAIYQVTLVAGRCLGAMADSTVRSSEVVCVPLMQRSVQPPLESLVTGGAIAEGLAHRASDNSGNMAALTVCDEGGVEIVTLGPDAVAEIVTVHHVALIAGWSVGSVTDGAVGGSQFAGVPLMKCPVEPSLESLVASRTIPERFPQRPSGYAGNVTALTVGDKRGMEVVPLGADSVAEIVMVHHVALIAGRSVGAVADGALYGSEVIDVGHMQRTARSPQETAVANGALPERLTHRATRHPVGVARFTGLDLGRNRRGMGVVDRSPGPPREVMTLETIRTHEAGLGNVTGTAVAHHHAGHICRVVMKGLHVG